MRILLLLLLAVRYLECSQPGPVVFTPSGPIRGVLADDGDYTMYLGVPYGTVEGNPFGDAKPPPKFTSVFDAVSDHVLCPQYDGAILGDINCLNLNIYVPNNKKSSKLPVMFYITGGGFVRSNGNRNKCGPKFLIQHDVIIVSINYRVGIYGFLCLDIPGYNNQGIKDQILALKWMKDNIESFGGDPNNVTIFGQSAGSTSIDLLLLIQEPLFQRVILQSGVALTPWVIAEMDNIPITVAKELGFETDDVRDALDYLKTINATEVTNATNNLGIYNLNGHPLTKPCVENEDLTAILTDYPVNLKPKVNNLDIMIGQTFREATFRYPVTDNAYYDNYKFDIELRRGFDEILDEKYVNHLYLRDETPSLDTRQNILDFASDFAFSHPIERTVDRFLEAGAKNVYRYLFTYNGDRNVMTKRMKVLDGALHSDDLGYLWSLAELDEEVNEDDQKMIDVMTKMFTDFAKFGNPTHSSPNELIPLTWDPVRGDQRPYLRIDQPLSQQHRVFNERMVFWDIYFKLHADKIKGKRN